MAILCFTGKYNGPTIEEYIKAKKSLWPHLWRFFIVSNFKDEAATWWGLLNQKKCSNLPDEEFEKLLLDRWSYVRKQDKENHVGLSPTVISLL